MGVFFVFRLDAHPDWEAEMARTVEQVAAAVPGSAVAQINDSVLPGGSASSAHQPSAVGSPHQPASTVAAHAHSQAEKSLPDQHKAANVVSWRYPHVFFCGKRYFEKTA